MSAPQPGKSRRDPVREKPRAIVRPLPGRLEGVTVDIRSVAVYLRLLCNSYEAKYFLCDAETPGRLPENVADPSGCHSPARPSALSNFRLPSRCKTENPVRLFPAYIE